jgi:hypothetical protein
MLGIGLDGIGLLRDWGVAITRIDFGFAVPDIERIAAAGFQIAVNASTADAALLDSLSSVRPAGWHNYYPRPETGISADFYLRQNNLFTARGLDLYSFIPGEISFRAPLHMGLPMLEEQRQANSYLAYVRLKSLCPLTSVVCAEGAILPEHARWIETFDRTGDLTLPLTGVDNAAKFLSERPWRVRVEETDYSWRLEETRSNRLPDRFLNAAARYLGSIQMDLPGVGRYQGEINIMRRDLPLSCHQARVAEIARPYEPLVECVRPGQNVIFE